MITQNSIVTGRNGVRYQLGAVLGSGGEGTVYRLQNPQLVAKIYKTADPSLERKLRYMIDHPIAMVRDQFGNLILKAAWPQDVIFDSNGRFVGYIMPIVEGGIEIFEIERCCTSAKAKALFPNYTWRLNVLVARNLAASVEILHQQGYIIGDMNCKNIQVNKDATIFLLDTDSIDLTIPGTGQHYKCCVGTEDYLAPELQGRNLRSEAARFTKEADNFALAIHIFRLLMNNYHPFSCRQLIQAKGSSNVNPLMQQIVEGKCPYIRNYPDISVPLSSPRMEEMLPAYIRSNFINTFDYNGANVMARAQVRTTASKWRQDLRQLLKECDTPGGLLRCSQNSNHFYLRSVGTCGLCAAENRMKQQYRPVTPPPKPITNNIPSNTTRPINTGPVNRNSVPPYTPPPSKPRWPAILVVILILLGFCFVKSTIESDRSAASRPAITEPASGSYGQQDSASGNTHLSYVNGTWADGKYTHSNGAWSGIYQLDQTLSNCKKFTLYFKQENTTNLTLTSFNLHLRSYGTWNTVGSFTMEKGSSVETRVLCEFPEGLTFDAVAVTPTINGNYSYYSWIGVEDVWLGG